eukprot:jgi/Galph1/2823/GphlegSOOS_G1491.1
MSDWAFPTRMVWKHHWKKFVFIPWEEIRLISSANRYEDVYFLQGIWGEVPVLLKLVDKGGATEAEGMLRNEIEIVKSISHSGIPKYYGWGENDDKLYLVMEKLEGASLQQRKLQDKLKGDLCKITEIFYYCVEAVGYLHSKKIIHRDLKPANFFVLKDFKTVKVLDFGVAKASRFSSTFTADTGTYWYMAPEVISVDDVKDDRQYDTKVDIYSLGVILNELLTGVAPYSEYPHLASAVLKEGLRPQLVCECSYSDYFQPLVKACWSSDPAMRPTASEMKSKLRDILHLMNVQVNHDKSKACVQQ